MRNAPRAIIASPPLIRNAESHRQSIIKSMESQTLFIALSLRIGFESR
ncbi:hypothetical protein ACS0Y6_12780 [Burkholderia gladioli]